MGFCVSTPILTANQGWTTVGELRHGDILFNSQGMQNPILSLGTAHAVSNPLCVNLNTGEKIVCDSDAEWLTNTSDEVMKNLRRDPAWREERKLKRSSRAVKNPVRPNQSKAAALSNSRREHQYLPKILPSFRSVSEIAKTLYVRESRKNHVLPVAESLLTVGQKVTIDPYTLGLFLGDGAVISTLIIMEAVDWENIQHLIPYRVASETRSGAKNHLLTRRFEQLRTELNALLEYTYHISPSGRKTKKFIKRVPNSIFMASFQDRLNCFKGLMDTDGTVDKERGRCEIGFSDLLLSTDTLKLMSSLGIKSTIRPKMIKGAKTHYRMQFNSSLPVFNLQRKLMFQDRSPKSEYVSRRYISKINPARQSPCRNISVINSELGYLLGNTLLSVR